MEQLAKALQDYKDANNLSLRALAAELGVMHGTAEGWLKGWRTPSYEHLPVIVEKIKIDELTIYRWLTEAAVREKSTLRALGLTTHRPLAIAA